MSSQISAALHTAIALKRFNISLPSDCQSLFISPFEPFLMLPAAKTGWSLQRLPMHGAQAGAPHGWVPTLVGVRPCLAGSEQIWGNDPQGKGRIVAVRPWGGLTSTQGREAGFGYQPAKRDIAQQRALAFSGAWAAASNHHPDNGTSLVPLVPLPKPATKTICPLKFPCDGVAEPHAVLEKGLESICHQSQPLILSGYYCIIEPGIEGQALIATMVSGLHH